MKNINSTQDQINSGLELLDLQSGRQYAITLNEIEGTEMGVGSLVTVQPQNLNGVIRWIGIHATGVTTLVGVELEEPCDPNNFLLSDGTFEGERFAKNSSYIKLHLKKIFQIFPMPREKGYFC